MAQNDTDDADDTPTEADTKLAVESATAGKEDDTPMTVSDDGTVSFGPDARGEKTAKVGGEEDEDEPPGLDAEALEKLRAKRREEKRRRREAARERENNLRGENAALQQTVQDLVARLQQVEQRTSSIDVARLDDDLRNAAYTAQSWKAVFEEAVKNQDGPGAAKAMEEMNRANAEGQRLFQVKEAYHQRMQQQGRPAIDPNVQTRVDAWRARHAWYNPQRPDIDTRIALAVDASVAADGFRPNTDAFWNELDRRLRERLPHRYENDDDDTPPASSNKQRRVPAAGGSGSSAGATQATFKLSAERVEAMKQAGIWNDPAKRDKMIRGFIAYDKEQRARGGQ